MFLLTNVLLLIGAFVFGFSRRPWWLVGPLALVACGPLQLAHFWASDWRYRLGLPHQEPLLDPQQAFWILGSLLFFAYVGYAAGVLCSRRGQT